MDKIYTKKMSANGSIQKSRQLHLQSETSSNVDVTKDELQSRNENFKMINTQKTSLYYSTNPNYTKRNDFRQSYDSKENSVEDSSRKRNPLIGKRESFYFNNSSSSTTKDLNPPRFHQQQQHPPHHHHHPRRNMTPPITSFKTNVSSSNSSASPQQQNSQYSHPHQLQYGAAIYQPPGNIQPMYPTYHQAGYVQAANNNNQQDNNQEIPPQQMSSNQRGGGRGPGGMNRRGRGRGGNSNANNGSRRDYRQNNNQQSTHPNSINTNEYIMDHQPYQPFYYTTIPYLPGSAIGVTTAAQNLTGQPLFAAQQQPYFFHQYGAYTPFVHYNLMPPQMPQMPTEILEGDQNQDANAPAAVYQQIPYHIAYQHDQHHLFTDPQLANTERLEFHGSLPDDEYQIQMENFSMDSEVPNVIENHGEIIDDDVDDVAQLTDYHESEIQNNNQVVMMDDYDDNSMIIEKTRNLIIDMKEQPQQQQQPLLEEKLDIDDGSSSLQFINNNNESNELKVTDETHHQQQQQPQIRKQTSCVPISSNHIQTNVIKKQTASVSVSAIPNKHFEEVKMNEFANEIQHQHEISQITSQNKNSFSSIAAATSSKHSPKSWKDEKKTETRQNNDSQQQRTSLSEQAKQQIATTISNSETSSLSSSSTSLKKDKIEVASQVSPKQPSTVEKTSTLDVHTTLEKNAQIAKQSSSVPPSSWAGLFVSEAQRAHQASSAAAAAAAAAAVATSSTTNPSSNQIKIKSTSDVSSSTSANQSSNNKLPGTMSYSAVSAQSIAIQSTPPQPQSANNNKTKPNTTSTATSTSSTTNNNDVSHANDVALKPTTPVDQNALKLGEFYSKYKIDYGSVSLMPRGLLNKSNYCYINAILQALVACPPFYHLMTSIPTSPIYYNSADSKSPVTDAMVELVSNFKTSKKFLREKSRNEVQDIPRDASFEPKVILKMLQKLRNDIFPIEGRQEDAEEFLSFILNKMNDEMIEMRKLVEKSVTKSKEETDDLNGNLETSENEEEWQVISGARNKSTITRTTDYGRSPISDIFGGKLRLRVHREGDHSSDNIEPFFTLKLVIERASSVREALDLLVGKDQLEGFTCAKTNQEISAWQQVTLEELPVVLILHLKCFDFKKEGCTKIMKNIEFPIELKIDQKLLASKNKYQAKQKQYKLFAVVYHDGKDVSKGHYVSDIWNGANSTWVRYDDATVKPVSDHAVLHPKTQNPNRVPYLLFYRRHDTIGGKKQGP